MPIKYIRTEKPDAPKSQKEQPELKKSDKDIELQPNNPLHGIKLADILNYLVEYYGWQSLGEQIKINCFNSNPSINSSLKFLRRTNWAREKVERLYIKTLRKN